MAASSGLIHVGAFDGSEYVGDKRRLLLFEPQAAAFKVLQKNLGKQAKAELVNAALGSTNGVAAIHIADPGNSSSLLSPTEGAAGFTGKTENVVVMTLDQAMRGRRGYNTLRIDTQGYELEVLRGGTKTLKKLKRIECEIHNPETYPGAATLDEIDNFLGPRFIRRAEAKDGDVVYELAK